MIFEPIRVQLYDSLALALAGSAFYSLARSLLRVSSCQRLAATAKSRLPNEAQQGIARSPAECRLRPPEIQSCTEPRVRRPANQITPPAGHHRRRRRRRHRDNTALCTLLVRCSSSASLIGLQLLPLLLFCPSGRSPGAARDGAERQALARPLEFGALLGQTRLNK